MTEVSLLLGLKTYNKENDSTMLIEGVDFTFICSGKIINIRKREENKQQEMINNFEDTVLLPWILCSYNLWYNRAVLSKDELQRLWISTNNGSSSSGDYINLIPCLKANGYDVCEIVESGKIYYHITSPDITTLQDVE